jgi:cysteine desulfurase family protein (TIGR01976 family)
MNSLDVAAIRQRFPALSRMHAGRTAAYFDGAAGSQVPTSVIEAVADYLAHHNANRGGVIPTSQETDSLMDAAHLAAKDFLGAANPAEIAFGQNMTSLTFSLSRALAKTWSPGDEIIVSRLDHDANVTPWVMAARDAGCVVKHIDIQPEDCTLAIETLPGLLSDRTKLVAVGYASNAVGTINPVKEICRQAQMAGALTFIDAVHFAPHGRINVAEIGCDFLACSAYKFFGPHVGLLYGRRELMEAIAPYKLRPAPSSLPGRWMTGTQSHESICGFAAAVDYLASLGTGATRVEKLDRAFEAIGAYEAAIGDRLLRGLLEIPSLTLWGLKGVAGRVPTFSVTDSRLTPTEMATRLAERGFWTWPGNHYALPLTERLGLEPLGTLRISLLHYNTVDEVDGFLAALRDLCRC